MQLLAKSLVRDAIKTQAGTLWKLLFVSAQILDAAILIVMYLLVVKVGRI